jgi:hypothetical protein
MRHKDASAHKEKKKTTRCSIVLYIVLVTGLNESHNHIKYYIIHNL